MSKKLAGHDKQPGAEKTAATNGAIGKAGRVAAGPPVKGRPSTVASVEPLPRSKVKLVRDSFTIPAAEYEVLQTLKARSVALARPAKKSELLRAGIAALQAMTDRKLLATLAGVPSLKTGRPKQDAAASPAAADPRGLD